MDADSPQLVFAQRLKQARAIRGLSLRALEEKIGGKVSYNALNKYEKGEMMPGSDVLVAVAEATEQPFGFFFRPLKEEIHTIKFRKKASLGKKAVEAIRNSAQEFFERYYEIESIHGLTPAFENPINMEIQTPDDAEKAANTVREAWKLGEDPLPNLHEILESKGIKVFHAEADEGFDGFSGFLDGFPVVVIGKRLDEQCLTRKRNTLAHELGHILFKDILPIDLSAKEEERIVHRFAGAFLLPEVAFRDSFGGFRKSISMVELVDIKVTFGVSIASIVYRAHQLKLVSDSFAKRFWQYRNTRWKNHWEPGDDKYRGNETSNRFKQLVWRATSEGLITRSKASELLNKPISVFRDSEKVFS